MNIATCERIGFRSAFSALVPPHSVAALARCGATRSIISSVYFRLTRQMVFQPSTNLESSPAPSKWLAPTLRKSYKMVFQMVTRSPIKSFIISIRICLAPSIACGGGLG